MPAVTTQLIDTLQCDTALVQRLQQSPSYDYTREFVQQDYSVIERIMRWLEDLFSTSVNKATDGDMSILWVIIGIIVVIAAGVYLYTHDVGLFRRSGKGGVDYEAQDEDIYGIDFDARIDQAVSQHDWREATRVTYLKTLRWLADNNRIDWALFKTPSQYTREEHSTQFRDMTNDFLRVRYGNFDATEETYNTMRSRSATLIAHISDEIAVQQPQEGGDA